MRTRTASKARDSDGHARLRRSVLLAATCVLLCLIAGGSAAVAHPSLEPTLTVQANAKLRTVHVQIASQVGARCRLRVQDEVWVRTFSQARLGSAGIRSWRIAAPVGLATAPWTFYATCTLGDRDGWRRYVAEMGFPELGGALVAGVAPSSAPGTSCDEQGLCFAADPIEPGQCGWYALGRRPELLPYIEHSKRAGEWLADAAGHLPEGSAPRVGALAIWSIASDPPDGHVGYVAATAGTRVLIDDSNWRPTPSSPGLQVHEHWVLASQPAGYIYAR